MTSQMPEQRVTLHPTFTMSRMAPSGTPRSPSSRRSMRISPMAACAGEDASHEVLWLELRSSAVEGSRTHLTRGRRASHSVVRIRLEP